MIPERKLADWLRDLEHLHPVEIELGLDRVAEVAHRLGLTSRQVRVVTVAGTNGKGSVVALLDQLLRASGQRVGRYMSPHLHDFRERAVIQGFMLPDRDWVQAFERIEVARASISLTYFEYTTLAALLLFQAANLDVWVLEVGMGGRLDAVNIVDADVAVITSIDLDHTEWLGPDREAIGREKAGILRPQGLCVVGDLNPPQSVCTMVRQLGVETRWMGVDFAVESSGQGCWLRLGTVRHFFPKCRLAPANIATALQALQMLLPAALDLVRFETVIAQCGLPGRCEVCPGDARVILDVAHNPHGARFLAEQLQDFPEATRTWVVLAMLKDKDRRGTVKALGSIATGFYLADLAGPRGGMAAELAEYVHEGIACVMGQFATPEQALEQALHQAGPNDRIVVCGSFYTVAAARHGLGMWSQVDG